jgi:hypothetical protein
MSDFTLFDSGTGSVLFSRSHLPFQAFNENRIVTTPKEQEQISLAGCSIRIVEFRALFLFADEGEDRFRAKTCNSQTRHLSKLESDALIGIRRFPSGFPT